MGQTILAVVAILVFSIFALNQHRAQASTELNAMGSEISIAATNLARERLIAATALAFDENVIGLTGFKVDPEDLTPFDRFGPGLDPGDDGAHPDDVDDFFGVTEAVTVERDGEAGREIHFTVTYGVRYVLPDAPGNPSPDNRPTLAKEVLVNVVEEPDGQTGRPPVIATLTQVVTPAWDALHG